MLTMTPTVYLDILKEIIYFGFIWPVAIVWYIKNIISAFHEYEQDKEDLNRDAQQNGYATQSASGIAVNKVTTRTMSPFIATLLMVLKLSFYGWIVTLGFMPAYPQKTFELLTTFKFPTIFVMFF